MGRVWGQLPLVSDPREPRWFRVRDGDSWGPISSSEVLAAGQARAVAVEGRPAEVWTDGGTAVTVRYRPGVGFECVPLGQPVGAWAHSICSVLNSTPTKEKQHEQGD